MDESNVTFMNFCHFMVVNFRMQLNRSILALPAGVALILSSCEEPESAAGIATDRNPASISDATPLEDFLLLVGAETKPRPAGSQDPGLAEAGRNLIYEGRLPSAEGQRLSEYFYCADCHSSEREMAILNSEGSASEHLDFAVAKELALQPAPSFAGVSNRLGFFESEMAKTLDPPKEANSSLEGAVQFCATTIAKGRELNPVEVQSVIAYLYSLEWRIGDLGFRGADLAELKRRALNPREHRFIREEMLQRFPARTIATPGEPPSDPLAGYSIEETPDPSRGNEIWAQACLQCHDAEGASPHFFGDRDSTYRKLLSLFEDGTVYRYIREGSGAGSGIQMPSFPKEKLGDKEIEDLRAFIRNRVTPIPEENVSEKSEG
ncbi:MAG: cytochrome c [Verrucomicrobiota bacterium]